VGTDQVGGLGDCLIAQTEAQFAHQLLTEQMNLLSALDLDALGVHTGLLFELGLDALGVLFRLTGDAAGLGLGVR
jgi:hypothetical protein